MRRSFIVSAVLMLLIPVAAFAQAPPPVPPPPAVGSTTSTPNTYLAAWLGSYFSGGFTHPLSTETKRVYGFTLGVAQRGVVSGEIEFSKSPNFVSDSKDTLIGGKTLLTLTGSMLIGPWIKFTQQQMLRPYIAIGGGLARPTVEDFTTFGETAQDRGVLDGGIGANLYLSRHFGATADMRYLRDVGSRGALCAADDPTCHSQGFGVTNVNYRRIHFGVLLAW